MPFCDTITHPLMGPLSAVSEPSDPRMASQKMICTRTGTLRRVST